MPRYPERIEKKSFGDALAQNLMDGWRLVRRARYLFYRRDAGEI
ncbi:MAG TPA: hypothetical protein VK400_06690 [Pyrinomonadaceae bacterium]|nr:hypothetical protein [Pyrinomonadaceae bacterium]